MQYGSTVKEVPGESGEKCAQPDTASKSGEILAVLVLSTELVNQVLRFMECWLLALAK